MPGSDCHSDVRNSTADDIVLLQLAEKLEWAWEGAV